MRRLAWVLACALLGCAATRPDQASPPSPAPLDLAPAQPVADSPWGPTPDPAYAAQLLGRQQGLGLRALLVLEDSRMDRFELLIRAEGIELLYTPETGTGCFFHRALAPDEAAGFRALRQRASLHGAAHDVELRHEEVDDGADAQLTWVDAHGAQRVALLGLEGGDPGPALAPYVALHDWLRARLGTPAAFSLPPQTFLPDSRVEFAHPRLYATELGRDADGGLHLLVQPRFGFRVPVVYEHDAGVSPDDAAHRDPFVRDAGWHPLARGELGPRGAEPAETLAIDSRRVDEDAERYRYPEPDLPAGVVVDDPVLTASGRYVVGFGPAGDRLDVWDTETNALRSPTPLEPDWRTRCALPYRDQVLFERVEGRKLIELGVFDPERETFQRFSPRSPNPIRTIRGGPPLRGLQPGPPGSCWVTSPTWSDRYEPRHTTLCRYDLTQLEILTRTRFDGIEFDFQQLWVDEAAERVYLLYEGALLSFALTPQLRGE